MIIDLIVGARPNFVKAAALLHAAEKFPQIKMRLVHTGQHEKVMSDPYFKDLKLPTPNSRFQLPSETTTGSRLAQMIHGLSMNFVSTCEPRPDRVMVVGDTDSTLAGAIAAAKAGIPVAHVEAGLRCGDLCMQEEINRVIVDSISDKNYASSFYAMNNLRKEGRAGVRVGNVMVDTLYRFLPEALIRYERTDRYAVFTLHRPETVDDPKKLQEVIGAVEEIATRIPVIWSVHPRLGPLIAGENIIAVEPMGYLQFIALLKNAKLVLTDSGGVQEETTALGVPCLTLRDSTERPETVFEGSNLVIGRNPERIMSWGIGTLDSPLSFNRIKPWGYDGHAADRIMEDLCATL